MYGFCSNNALYLISSFAVFIFPLTLFDTWDCYYFDSNLSLVFFTKVLLIKKHVTLFSSLLPFMSLFLCLSRISLGRYCKKMSKVEKRYKRGQGVKTSVLYKLFGIGFVCDSSHKINFQQFCSRYLWRFIELFQVDAFTSFSYSILFCVNRPCLGNIAPILYCEGILTPHLTKVVPPKLEPSNSKNF